MKSIRGKIELNAVMSFELQFGILLFGQIDLHLFALQKKSDADHRAKKVDDLDSHLDNIIRNTCLGGNSGAHHFNVFRPDGKVAG